MVRWLAGLVVALSCTVVMAQETTKKGKVDADAIFKKLDTDSNGYLSKNEFLKLAEFFKDKEKAREKLTMTFEKLRPGEMGLSREQFRKYIDTVRKKDES